ncbi:hypothetical protein [Enterobacter bugandensis]|uniref:hypothetical protein n=1 Tax=Enterobacter bugandensis TaxID=881260 RepID=UPI002075EC24|nr:hypothetical protein [Enterobacter bugandensis]MCM7631297.1 hypothetical protein [Enterobacter bugandensis]
MKQKFIEWFTKNNNGCSPAMEDDRSFVREKTQHMFEAYQAGVAEGEARCAALAAENARLKDLARSWANATDDRLFEEHGEIFHDSIDACEEELKTICPATDAFLAEVRAQGVEMFAKEMHADISGDDAREFAAQIRKGGATEEKQSFLSNEDCHAFIKAFTKGAAQ